MPCAVPVAPRITCPIMWPKIKTLGRKVTARFQHHHLLSQFRRQEAKSYLISFKITNTHTSVSLTIRDGDRKNTKGKQNTSENTWQGRKEKKGRAHGRKTDIGSQGDRFSRCGVRSNKLPQVKPGLVRLPQSFPLVELAFQAKSF